ncbi:MAG TPA: IPT/TIG domain-containing protein [Acidobacteriaceae bacterium]
MPPFSPTPRRSKICAALIFLAAFAIAHAGGPRWYTGTPFYTAAPGGPVVFFTTSPLYYTDPGDLAANVTHAQADAMVAAAAATWNVPTSNLTLALGGTLAEHVSSANTYFDGTSVVFPDDIKLANYHAKPIAIAYDTDGSVIDTLLGSGASSPSGCRQNGVVEDVDGLDPAGTIDHAILILNGRCVGANPDQLKQMQYQLMREFGRIIGLAWSQLNDNVFTGIPTPTAIQVLNWPIMHPIDVICGPYTYKCMAQPFTLRADDLSALAELYPVTTASPGKTVSGDGALLLFGNVTFPTGQGMDSVNVVLRRTAAFLKQDPYEITSAVSGANHRQYYGNPVTGPAAGLAQSSGGVDNYQQGQYYMQRVPIVSAYVWDELDITTEPINPLYSGDYAIAPYLGDPTAMSGTPVTIHDGLELAGRLVGMDAEMNDAPNSCNTGSDGVETAPVATDPSGFWTGLLCSYQHSAWISETVQPGHTWTLETTALNEAGIGAGNKAQIVMGVWNASDPTGTLPTVTLTPSPFNATVVGMTQLHMDSAAAAQTYRIAISDLRGQGRPDFAYNARMLYAGTISPTVIGASGGRIAIAGEGFRNGNGVTVNGVAVTVISWTPNQIVFFAPSMRAANMTASGFADVAVVDPSTGGTTVIQGALSYTGTAVDSISLVSAPSTVTVGTQSATPFSVRVLSSDGATPAPGATVQVVVTGAAATFAACGAATCTLTTDASGMAQTYLTASAAGPITLTATEQSSGASVQAIVNAVAPPPPPVRTVVSLTAPLYIAAGAPATWTVSILATQDSAPAASQTVAWTATSTLTPTTASSTTDSTGAASLTVSTTGLTADTQATVQGCIWTTVCASATAFGVDPSQWTVLVVSGAGQSVQAAATLSPVVFRVTDLAGHAVQSATVNIYQTVDAWEGICSPRGRCAAAPVLASSRKTLTADADGLVTVPLLEVPNTASVVHIAASSGTEGFISLSLTKTP